MLIFSSKLPPTSYLTHFLRTLSSISAPSHAHIAHLLLEQKSPTQLLHTFQWASKLPSFTHSPSTYRALIHKLCIFRRFDTAYQVLDEMPHSPDERIFVTLIHGLGRAHLVKKVVNVLDLVARYNQKPSLKIFNSILDVLVKEDIDIAREFYRKKMMASGVKGDDYTFGILMKGLCLTNRIGEGFKLLQAIKSRGVAPNTVVYNTLLHALCRNGKVGRARSLMSEMEDPNDVTFNILISGYCGEENLVQALVMLEKCFGLGYVPDVVTITKVLEILCNDGRVMEAVKTIERVESNGGLVDVVGYNTLIKGFCQLGKAKIGLRILKEMERKGCLPNVETYNILISGFCESGMSDEALDLFNDMKTDGISWNFATYDTLIRGLCSGGRTEDGLKILDLMNESKNGCRGRISPYNSVLYGLYKENRLDEALEFLAHMGKLFPRAVDRSLRILGFCEEGDTENAKKLYDQMIVERAVPCVLIYDYLIHRFCHIGCVRHAFELMNEMIAHCYFPVATTFDVLIKGFCEQGKVESALKLLEEMVGRDCLPGIESYNHLVGALCQKGDFQKALKLVLQMVGKGIAPDYFTWHSMLLCSSRETVWLNSKSIFYVNSQLHCITEA
ncbi:pentatricopeptide repeat-containing protein At2g17525, mitochondrial [Argentina anserina]|uniref:pentatricopeptide repeat-containing protein At2g17525, mitochondrial n=1 Tax=Argentina anserina TaxID=57926 RepID=UPI0021764EE5|nr:pentatricopeptide repeat-containing protein At2g17525, mitochondrial [Potentilla anserina]